MKKTPKYDHSKIEKKWPTVAKALAAKQKIYNPQKIESKWQREWLKKKTFVASNKSSKKKFYSLIEFPYPSGEGLHVGHPRPYIGMDIISRKRRMEGFNVLYPIGWDAFGLPTENFAIKTGKSPEVVTKKNTDTFRRQIQSLGISFDWSREINTTDPKYYKWTQWIFLQMWKNNLAYKKKMSINWCPKDKIGLANEEVIDGKCERCGTVVEKRDKEQWMLAITKYADRLDKDLDTADYLPQIKLQQRNWIGRSEGAEIPFKVEFKNDGKTGLIYAFTTRPDTLFGAFALILSPEHPWVTLAIDENHKGVLENVDAVRKYVTDAAKKEEIDRTDAKKEKTGVKLEGVWAVNPANDEKIPIFVADFVLAQYGTGALFADANDERDFEFATKYKLPIKYVLAPRMIDHSNPHVAGKKNVFRNAIIAIVRNPKDGKIINLKWKKQPWTTFVMGGVEDGEDIVEAARREIIEETGYKNVKFIRILGGPVQSEFFAAHKDVNRVAHTSELLFELENEEHDSLSDEEAAIHEVIWVDPKTLDPKTLAHIEAPLILDRLLHGEKAYTGEGILINSGKFNGMTSAEARKAITEFVGGKMVTTYKLRDWIFSRQRYWGEPIPLIHCEKCGYLPVPDKDLPVKLPKVKNYQPTDNGDSPLADITSWVNVKCPQCKGPARRETDTMPNWAGSSWYYLRYTDPKNNKKFADPKALKYWTPVDWYNGGMEHTTLHLLYSRFWHKFLYDQKLVPTSEPYKKRTAHGLILAEGGEKMSKSKGNVINPDAIVKLYGADSLRLYEMFMGPFDQAIPWSTESIIGVRRFLEKVWRLQEKAGSRKNIQQNFLSGARGDKSFLNVLAGSQGDIFATLVQKTIAKVSQDIEDMHFNTCVSALMILANEMEKQASVSKSDFEIFLKLLSPFAPHIAEELWSNIGHKKSIALEPWPVADPGKLVAQTATIAVQVNGKVRGQVIVATDSDETTVLEAAKSDQNVAKWMVGGQPKKVIYVKNRLINIVF